MQPLLFDEVQFRIHAAISAILMLKIVLHAFSVGGARVARRAWSSPEDVKLLGGSVTEDALAYIVLGLLFVLVGAPVVGIQAYGYTFLAARVVHSIACGFGLQPFRTLAFAVGSLCLIGMAVQVLMAAFR